jgi:undecaprenyl-diphosphatase
MAAGEIQTGNSVVKPAVARRWSIFAIALALCAVAGSFAFDSVVREWIVLHQTPGVVAFMSAVSVYGDWPSHIIIAVLLAAIAYAKGSKQWVRILVGMMIACAIAGAAARVVKVSVGRARPTVHTDVGWNGPRFGEKYHAFPSGHTASSTAFFGVLAFAAWRIGTPLLVVPLLIAFSRMYVGAHYLSDVVAAGMLGLLTAWLVARALARRIAPSPQTSGRIGSL